MQNGVVQVKDIAFAASPGYNYSLRLTSPNVKPDISNNSTNDKMVNQNNIKSALKSNLTQKLLNITEID